MDKFNKRKIKKIRRFVRKHKVLIAFITGILIKIIFNMDVEISISDLILLITEILIHL